MKLKIFIKYTNRSLKIKYPLKFITGQKPFKLKILVNDTRRKTFFVQIVTYQKTQKTVSRTNT